jgi:YD repeat-containing protein
MRRSWQEGSTWKYDYDQLHRVIAVKSGNSDVSILEQYIPDKEFFFSRTPTMIFFNGEYWIANSAYDLDRDYYDYLSIYSPE